MNHPLTLTLLGCGKMGTAMVRGWLASDLKLHINIIEPNALENGLTSHKNVTHFETPNAAITASDIFILAVKPQVMQQACESIKEFIKPHALILSIAAGQSLERFAGYFGEDQPAIRVMPNTPAAIGKGVSVLVANTHVSAIQKRHAETLLESAGLVRWIEDEALMNAVTALSGSGPAYVFLMIETLAKAGEKAGLAPNLAMTLSRQTVIGAAALAEAESSTPAATLRQNVTSPGGTTAAALDVLMNGELQELFDKALLAAKSRGEDLG